MRAILPRLAGFRLRWAVGLLGLPAAVGLALAWAYRAGWLERQVLYLRISLDNAAVLAGLALSGLVLLVLGTALSLGWRWQRRVETVRQQAREERRQFLLRLDHELKNSLTTLQMELGSLSRSGEASPLADAGALARLTEQIHRLSELGLQLRKLAELEDYPLEKEPTDLARLLEELVAEFSRVQPRPRLELNVSRVPWPPPAVEADSDLIYLALYNLLGNALKFSDPDDAVLVRAFEDGRWVAVEIADSGQGIPAAEQPHVFDELYRGQLARGLPGSGLGLSLVRAIVERHGGQLSLRSRLGQGTVVTVRLPTRV